MKKVIIRALGLRANIKIVRYLGNIQLSVLLSLGICCSILHFKTKNKSRGSNSHSLYQKQPRKVTSGHHGTSPIYTGLFVWRVRYVISVSNLYLGINFSYV